MKPHTFSPLRWQIPPKAVCSLRKCNVGYVWSPLQLDFFAALRAAPMVGRWRKETETEFMLHLWKCQEFLPST